MPANQTPRLAQLLFPGLQPHLQRRWLRHFISAVLVGASVAGVVGFVMVRLALK